MTQSWFTPAEFCYRFAENPKLVEAVVDINTVPFRFKDYIVRVGSRQQYAEECRHANKESYLAELDFPLIDKKVTLFLKLQKVTMAT